MKSTGAYGGGAGNLAPPHVAEDSNKLPQFSFRFTVVLYRILLILNDFKKRTVEWYLNLTVFWLPGSGSAKICGSGSKG